MLYFSGKALNQELAAQTRATLTDINPIFATDLTSGRIQPAANQPRISLARSWVVI